MSVKTFKETGQVEKTLYFMVWIHKLPFSYMANEIASMPLEQSRPGSIAPRFIKIGLGQPLRFMLTTILTCEERSSADPTNGSCDGVLRETNSVSSQLVQKGSLHHGSFSTNRVMPPIIRI
jgi:hypothetical protein